MMTEVFKLDRFTECRLVALFQDVLVIEYWVVSGMRVAMATVYNCIRGIQQLTFDSFRIKTFPVSKSMEINPKTIPAEATDDR